MRLPDSAHTSRAWRIHAIAPEFRLEDVWQLPWRGGPDDFPRLVSMLASGTPAAAASPAVRALFAARMALGSLLGWDGAPQPAPSLRDRLPAALRGTPAPAFDALPFEPLYLLDDEFAAEIANRTMHGVLHLGRVPAGDGTYRAQMAVLVKPEGLLGHAYMAAITPFRRLLVYPALLRQWERAWQRREHRGRPVG